MKQNHSKHTLVFFFGSRIKSGMTKGQSIIEYTIYIGVIVMAMIFMTPAIKRGVQSVIKTTSDQLAPQSQAEQNFDSGFLRSSVTDTEATQERTVLERNYTTTYQTTNDVTSKTTTESNLGFSSDDNQNVRSRDSKIDSDEPNDIGRVGGLNYEDR